MDKMKGEPCMGARTSTIDIRDEAEPILFMD